MMMLELVERQRRFEWELARDEQTRAAARLVAGKTHDLLNLIQIIKLAGAELVTRCDPSGQELVADLARAAGEAETSLASLLQAAGRDQAPMRGAPVGATITQIVDEVRPAISITLHLAIAAETATALTAEELSHLVIGLALDGAASSLLELYVRDRSIDDAPWVEIVRGADLPVPEAGASFDLRAVEALVARGGGELSQSERRGGGSELVIALPALQLLAPA